MRFLFVFHKKNKWHRLHSGWRFRVMVLLLVSSGLLRFECCASPHCFPSTLPTHVLFCSIGQRGAVACANSSIPKTSGNTRTKENRRSLGLAPPASPTILMRYSRFFVSRFCRYFNESSPPTRTLALGGTAPVAATFITAPATSAHGRPPSRAATVGGAGEEWVSGTSTNGTGGTLRVNLQTCSSTDRPASDGVLHVLAFDDGDNARGTYDFLYGDSGSDGSGGSAAGVLVPDVLELTYAYGFRATYEAIVATAAAEADGLAVDNTTAVADALRGRAPHTLLAVASVDEKMRRNPREKHASSPSFDPSWWVRDNGPGISANTLRCERQRMINVFLGGVTLV